MIPAVAAVQGRTATNLNLSLCEQGVRSGPVSTVGLSKAAERMKLTCAAAGLCTIGEALGRPADDVCRQVLYQPLRLDGVCSFGIADRRSVCVAQSTHQCPALCRLV